MKIDIERRVLIMMLLCSIISLIISAALSLYGMFGVKSVALETGVAIGDTAAKSSNEILENQAKEAISQAAKEKAKQIELYLQNIQTGTNLLSQEMTNIMKNPQNYSAESILGVVGDGSIYTKVQYSPEINRNSSALQNEVALLANLQDMLIGLNDVNKMVASTYVASESGFIISADRTVDMQNNGSDYEPFEPRTRPWYKKAQQEQKLIFTDVFNDVEGGGLAITCAAPYFNANGNFAGVVGIGSYLNEINQIVLDTKVGTTGFGFVINKESKILFSPKESGEMSVNLDSDKKLIESDNESLRKIAEKMTAGEAGVGSVTIDGKTCYLSFAPLNTTQMSFGVVIEESEVIAPASQNKQAIMDTTDNFLSKMNEHIYFVFAGLGLTILFLIATVAFSANKMAQKFVKPIHELTDGVREIASGNLDKKLDIQTGDEIEHLSICFNAMTDELKTYMNNLTKITAEKERIATELDVAKNIQTSMLPNIFPAFPDRKEFDIYATMNAAKEVGGDFYDFYLLDENHLVVTIADVSGKGIPAALFMMISKTILKNFSMTMNNPDDFAAVMTLSNNQLCQNNDAMMFVTVFMGMLDIKTGEFTFVNGGHNPPVVYHKSTDSYEYLKEKKNFVLGGMEDIDFVQQSVKLEKGDIIFMYTDGVTEALNPTNELYGEERLINCLNRSDRSLSVEELLAFVRADVNTHVNGAAQSDDITMLALKVN